MDRVLVRDLGKEVGKEAKISGFVMGVKDFKTFRFLLLRDRSGTNQVVVPHQVCNQKFNYEDVVSIRGLVVDQMKNKYSNVELLAKEVEFVARGEEGTCFVPKSQVEVGLDATLDRRAASLRLDVNQRAFIVQSRLIRDLSSYFAANDFIEVKTPKIIISATEGGANLFKVDYFGMEAYLSQSPQLYHQMLMASFERVFEIGPCFRAEDYATTRHINEFTTLDLEIGFIKDHFDVMKLLESALSSVQISSLKVPSSIPMLSYREALGVLQKEGEYKFNGEDKRVLGLFAKNNYHSDFLFLHGFPRSTAHFYVMPDGEDTRSFRLIYKGQEVCAGGQRINNLNQLKEGMASAGVSTEGFKDYLDAFRCGVPPHGGLCFGLNRFTALALDLDNVKRAVLFPRDPKRLTP